MGEQAGGQHSDPRIPAPFIRAAAMVLLFGRLRQRLLEHRIELDVVARAHLDPRVARHARDAATAINGALQELAGVSIFPVGRTAVLFVSRVRWPLRPFVALWVGASAAWAVIRG